MTTEEEISQLKQRISYLEGQISFMQHELDKKGIVLGPYGPYIPYTSPVVIPSDQAPYKWQVTKFQKAGAESHKTS